MKPIVNIFWFRRDLRLHDNAGLYHALKTNQPVVPVFIFDRNILDKLEDKNDRRVAFIHAAILNIQKDLTSIGSSLEVYHGSPVEVFQDLCSRYTIRKAFGNADYEPYARERDEAVQKFLLLKNSTLETFKDHVIFDKNEILKDAEAPYTVFTPFSKKWKAVLTPYLYKPYPTLNYSNNFYRQDPVPVPSLEEIGFEEVPGIFPSTILNPELLSKYSLQRNYPAANGTSKMGVHLRFGTVSVRNLVEQAVRHNETYLNELIWRDFYQMILWHFPHVGKGRAFRPQYDLIDWRNNEDEFQRWCEGRTGYPLVDAGMRELNATGYMHNRIRMLVASFLTKHLLIDWRWGEAYFAQKLLDFDLASNNGGWQWAAGSGCDAVPYFRIFNPYIQAKKFDPEFKYIRQWVPEFEEFTYPKPIVEHEFARKRCIETYSNALKESFKNQLSISWK